MNTMLRIFTATFLGAFTGAIIALQLIPGLCWVGFLFGGIIGYFTYKPKEVIEALPRAWAVACFSVHYVRAQPIKPLRLSFWSVFVTVWFTTTAMLASLTLRYTSRSEEDAWFLVVLIALANTGALALPILAAAEKLRGVAGLYQSKEDLYDSCAIVCMANLLLFPVVLVVVIGWVVVEVCKFMVGFLHFVLTEIIALTIKTIKNLPQFCFAFVGALLRLIHSDIRLLCGANACLGSVVGYCYGHALFGAAIAAIAAVGMYHIAGELLKRCKTKQTT